MITQQVFQQIVCDLKERGFGSDIDWSENLQPVSTPEDFWRAYAWVVLNSNMRHETAGKIWERVRPTVEKGLPTLTVFRNKRKAAAIDRIWLDRDVFFKEYLEASDKLGWLQSLPQIGPITRYHLAKDLGLDFAKPDRHLVRIAASENPHTLCARLSRSSGYRIRTVDFVLWRAAKIGLI